MPDIEQHDYMGWRGFCIFVAALIGCAVAWGFLLARLLK